jgi:DNA-binding winged helix-turn-helix (wHTH) protein/tetratricopeptide (TPR) repeat protein
MGQFRQDGLAIPGRVVLAHEPPFNLGSLRITPGTRQAQNGSRSETLEPRVMQALVALARAEGEIVTRDELIDRCWDGRIVSDDAINRVLSRIRQVANGVGGDSFCVQTIPKVGYRLTHGAVVPPTSGGSADQATPRRRLASRRAVLAGAVATVAAGGAAGLVWQRPWRHRPIPEAQQLYERGMLLSREGLPGQVKQATSYFERATAIDPEYSDAWGALALSYSHLLHGFDDAELGSLPGRIRAAADRALKLDPDNADAQLALIFMTPYFGNWTAKERQLRQITEVHPRHWLAHARLGVLLYQVGRLTDGIEQHRKAVEIEPTLPIAYYFMIRALSALGRAQEAEALINRARDRWPAHPALWIATFSHFLFSGRPKSAAAFVINPDTLPSGFGPAQVEWRVTLARAIDSQAPRDVEASLEKQRQLAAADAESIPFAAMVFAALGRPDLVRGSIERYFFDRGSFGSPLPRVRYRDPSTDFLFSAPMAAVRAKPEFPSVIRELGLDIYWRQTSTTPDYRRP